MDKRTKKILVFLGLLLVLGTILILWALPERDISAASETNVLMQFADEQTCYILSFPDQQVAVCDSGLYQLNPIAELPER